MDPLTCTRPITKDSIYLRFAYSLEDIPDIAAAHFTYDGSKGKWFVDNYPYVDPDARCKELYEDMLQLFFCKEKGDSIVHDPNDSRQWIIRERKCPEVRLSADYIGPSLTAMRRAGMSWDEIWKVTITGRRIGGHLVWPRIKGGINPGKAQSGGRGYGISDRIDVALYEVKNYLEGRTDAEVLNKRVRNAFNIDITKRWFEGMSFPEFCDRFMLKGSFVDDNYDIVWFSDQRRQRITREIMEEYVGNNLDAIEKRNRVIEKNLY